MGPPWELRWGLTWGSWEPLEGLVPPTLWGAQGLYPLPARQEEEVWVGVLAHLTCLRLAETDGVAPLTAGWSPPLTPRGTAPILPMGRRLQAVLPASRL